MKLSLLMKPFSTVERFTKDVERRLNFIKYTLTGNKYKAWTCSFSEGGHQDVVDSIIKGSEYYPEIELQINPSRSEAVGTVVYVPSGWRALRCAIELKRKGLIPLLIAGPTVCDLPHMHNCIIADPAVDCCIVASEWVKKIFLLETAEKYPDMNIKIWAAGVDQEYWKPTVPFAGNSANNALIYVKNSGAEMLTPVLSLLMELNCKSEVIYNGAHTPEDYKRALAAATFVIVLGESETQGLAISQAWSMDRPTFVFASPVISKYHRNYLGNCQIHASCAPYINRETGLLWRDVTELKNILSNVPSFSPRRWVLTNQTNEIAFSEFMDIVKNLGS